MEAELFYRKPKTRVSVARLNFEGSPRHTLYLRNTSNVRRSTAGRDSYARLGKVLLPRGMVFNL